MGLPLRRLLVVALLATGCTSGAPAAESASPPAASAAKPAIDERTRGAIQALLQREHDTMAARDESAFATTIDPERLALRRCATQSYESAGRLGVGAVAQVGRIEPYLDTYVTAYVEEAPFGQRRRFFRQMAGGAWVETEPRDEELGGERTTTVGDIQIDYWGIDQPSIDALDKASLAAQAVVLANLLSSTRRDPFAVRFYPTRSVAGIQGCLSAAYHLINAPKDPYIRVFQYWFTPTGDLAPYAVAMLTHEWLHWAQEQYNTVIASRLPFWLLEGWPDFVGGSRTLGEIKFSLCRTPTPTLKQLEDGADPNAAPELALEYYAFADTMVEYLYAKAGGIAGYRRLLDAFTDDARPSVAFPKALGVTPEQFYAAWKDAATRKYC